MKLSEMITAYMALYFTDNEREVAKEKAETEYNKYESGLSKDISFANIERLEALAVERDNTKKDWKEKADRYYDLGTEVSKWMAANSIESITAPYQNRLFKITKKPSLWNIDVVSV